MWFLAVAGSRAKGCIIARECGFNNDKILSCRTLCLTWLKTLAKTHSMLSYFPHWVIAKRAIPPSMWWDWFPLNCWLPNEWPTFPTTWSGSWHLPLSKLNYTALTNYQLTTEQNISPKAPFCLLAVSLRVLRSIRKMATGRHKPHRKWGFHAYVYSSYLLYEHVHQWVSPIPHLWISKIHKAK